MIKDYDEHKTTNFYLMYSHFNGDLEAAQQKRGAFSEEDMEYWNSAKFAHEECERLSKEFGRPFTYDVISNGY